MSTNPYESPKAQQPISHVSRSTALRSLRSALLIMLAPAAYNFACFNFPFTANRNVLPIHRAYQAINSIGFIVIVLAVWFFGLAAFEFITRGVHAIAARKSQLVDWKSALYNTFQRSRYFVIHGAILWAFWVFAFYQLRLGFYMASVPVGVAAHLLAACLYLPLLYRWYKLERSAAGQTPP